MKDMKKIVSTVSIILTWLVVILTPYLIRAKKLLKARPFVSLRVTVLLAILTVGVIVGGAKNLYSAVWYTTSFNDFNSGSFNQTAIRSTDTAAYIELQRQGAGELSADDKTVGLWHMNDGKLGYLYGKEF